MCALESQKARDSLGPTGLLDQTFQTHLNHMKEFCDHSGYASEKGRPAASFHLVAEAFHFNECSDLIFDDLSKAIWIHLRDGGNESNRYALCPVCTLKGGELGHV